MCKNQKFKLCELLLGDYERDKFLCNPTTRIIRVKHRRASKKKNREGLFREIEAGLKKNNTRLIDFCKQVKAKWRRSTIDTEKVL